MIPRDFRLAGTLALVFVLGRPAERISGAAQTVPVAPAPEAASRPVAVATPIDQPPSIDGRLDEPVWRRIDPIVDFRQREPNEGADPTERTEVRIAYDQEFLYLGLTMFDSEPEAIRATILQREGRIDQDDRVIIGLDTYHDRRNGYIFELNAFGTQGDALVTDEGDVNWDWEGVYWSEGRITADGWQLEIAVPFTTLRYRAEEAPEMGIAFYRSIRRKNEEVTWPLIGLDYRRGIFQVSRYATLTGLRNLRRQRNLEIKPYVLVGAQEPGIDGPGVVAVKDVGADAKYGVTSNSTLDLTYNTDFAQVEADNAQINLTRFNLFFPEKREFFLERAGLFAFGTQNEAMTFFSRRIGIVQDILVGARFSGQEGPFSIGLLNIQTRDGDVRPGENYGVARLRADVLPRTTVGAIATNVQGSGTYNRVAGGDVAVRFWGSSQATAWVSKVWTPEALESTAAGNATMWLQSDRYGLKLDYLNVGRNFDPAAGFVRRRDMVQYLGEGTFSPRIGRGDRLVRQLTFTGGGTYIEGQNGEQQSAAASGKASVRFESGDEVGVDVDRQFERLDVPFEIAPSVLIPVGDYGFTEGRVWTRTNSSRRLYGEVGVGHGSFFGGQRDVFDGVVLFKFSEHLSLGGNLEHNALSLPVPRGDFSTTLLGLSGFVAVSRALFANALIQYDNVSGDFQANIRVNWIHTPGSDLFVVFNTNRRVRTGVDTPRLDLDAGVIKLTYLFAF